MAGPATVLREIHRLRRHTKELQEQIDRAPRLLKAQQAKITRQEEAYKEAQDALKQLKVENLEKEGELKTALQQIAKHEKQLNEAGSKKEYDALKVEITEDKKKCRALEDLILECMAQIEDKTAQLPEAQKAVQQAKQECADFEKNALAREVGLREQLEKAVKELRDVELGLPEDVRSLYDRQVAARGADGMAAVENRTCMACYTEITAQSYNNLVLSQFVVCKSCGRALYLPE